MPCGKLLPLQKKLFISPVQVLYVVNYNLLCAQRIILPHLVWTSSMLQTRHTHVSQHVTPADQMMSLTEDLSSVAISTLKAFLHNRGISTLGSKATLTDSLSQYVRANPAAQNGCTGTQSTTPNATQGNLSTSTQSNTTQQPANLPVDLLQQLAAKLPRTGMLQTIRYWWHLTYNPPNNGYRFPLLMLYHLQQVSKPFNQQLSTQCNLRHISQLQHHLHQSHP